jgi:hypothetical protein
MSCDNRFSLKDYFPKAESAASFEASILGLVLELSERQN